MRPATTHDLVTTTVVLAFFSLCTVALQIVVVAKTTIPADEAVAEIRIMRSEQASQSTTTALRLAEIEAILDTSKAREEVIQSFK
jgi:hypothetical protein